MFESSIDGQKNKRGVDVREHQHDGERAVQEVANRLAGEVQILQEAIHHAFAHRPQAVRKHERVGEQEERANPDERREGNERFVGARVHGKVVSLYSATRVGSQSEKTKSCSPASGPLTGTRTRNVWPLPQSTSSNSLEPP